MVNSRQKGSAGEREAAKAWSKLFGVDMRRSQQFCGRSDESDDIVGQPGISFEIKRVQKLNIQEAVNKTVENAAEGLVPLVMHRKNHEEWLVTVRLQDLPKLSEVCYRTLLMGA